MVSPAGAQEDDHWTDSCNHLAFSFLVRGFRVTGATTSASGPEGASAISWAWADHRIQDGGRVGVEPILPPDVLIDLLGDLRGSASAVSFNLAYKLHFESGPRNVDPPGCTSYEGLGMEADITLMELLEGLHDLCGAARGRSDTPCRPCSPWPSSPCLPASRLHTRRSSITARNAAGSSSNSLASPVAAGCGSPTRLPDLPPHRCRRLRGCRLPLDLRPAQAGRHAPPGDRWQDPSRSCDGEYSRSPSLVRLRPGCRSRRGRYAGRCQDQRTEGGARPAGDLAHQGPPHHRRRHPDPSRDLRRSDRGGRDYILPVKDNQPTLRAHLEAAFAAPEAGLSPLQSHAAVLPAWSGPRPWTRGMVGSRSGRWS